MTVVAVTLVAVAVTVTTVTMVFLAAATAKNVIVIVVVVVSVVGNAVVDFVVMMMNLWKHCWETTRKRVDCYHQLSSLTMSLRFLPNDSSF